MSRVFPFEIYRLANPSGRRQAVLLALMLLLGFIITGMIMIGVGANPLAAYKALFEGAFRSKFALGQTVMRTLPLAFIGLGMTVCLKARLFNIGGNGFILAGGMAATAIGLYLPGLPGIVAVPLTILAGALAGAIWSGIPGFFRAKYNIDVIYLTVMMNHIMIHLSNYLIDNFWRERTTGNLWSEMIATSARWPQESITGLKLHLGVVLVLVFAVIVYYISYKLPFGYEVRAFGESSRAAWSKFKPKRVRTIVMGTMLLMGALGGIAGAGQVCGGQFRFSLEINDDYGFRGILVAKLGHLNPFGTLLSSLFLGALISGSSNMQIMTGVPASMVNFLQGLLLLGAIVSDRLALYGIRRRVAPLGGVDAPLGVGAPLGQGSDQPENPDPDSDSQEGT